jgi:hypothetical protein
MELNEIRAPALCHPSVKNFIFSLHLNTSRMLLRIINGGKSYEN